MPKTLNVCILPGISLFQETKKGGNVLNTQSVQYSSYLTLQVQLKTQAML
jgi:hypothetical protein